MTASCEFMRMAIHRSIDFTKSSSNIALVPALETVDLEGTVRAQLHMIRSLKPGVQINLSNVSVGVCNMVVTDKHWLAENVLCLLSNAVKYSDGGPIGIRFDVVDTALRITISDTGIGVPESVRTNLFHPFQQAQKMAGGTGLGLYSMRKRVDALAGDCGVASRDDGARGSAFWFEFPYRPDISAMKAAARSLHRTGSCRSALPAQSSSDSDGDCDSSAIDGSETRKRRPDAIAALGADGGRVADGTGIRNQASLVAIDVYMSPAQGLLELDRGWAVRRSLNIPQQLRILLSTSPPEYFNAYV
jgi:hypothetical protein